METDKLIKPTSLSAEFCCERFLVFIFFFQFLSQQAGVPFFRLGTLNIMVG